MTAREVLLDGGSPWGFRMNGGADVGHALRISRVNPGSKAAQKGVREGDVISSINGQPTKCLTNGESHALLRTVGETLRLGLNQDANGSPKRRSKEPVKRETSSSSTHSTPGTPVLGDATPAHTASEATSPSDQSEPTSAGAKVFVCGIWNSVNKTKERGKKGAKTEAQVKSVENPPQRVTESTVQDPVPKTSSSKARRMRKLKLKNGKRDEQTAPDHESEETVDMDRNTEDRRDEDDTIELVVVMEEEDIRRVEADVSRNEGRPSESASVVKETTTTVDNTSKTTKSKTKKKNGKNKGFSLSQIFTSKNDKINSSDDVKTNVKDSTNITTEQICDKNRSKEIVLNEKSIRVIPAALAEATGEIVKEILAESNMEANEHSNQQYQSNISSNQSSNILPEVTIKEPPILNPSTTFTIVDRETILGPSKTEMSTEYVKSASSVLKDCKTIAICSSETINESKVGVKNNTNKEIVEDLNTVKDVELLSLDLKNIDHNQSIKTNNETEENTKITIFVVPPDNVAVETEAPGVNWESVSNLDSKSQNTSSNDEVRPETLVHLPSNDLQASAVMKEGRNGIVQIDDYDLSVQDLYSPFMAPEEEARLRSFLETLNLTQPEEYDDTSSSKSYGDSSSTSISESSPIPPPSSDEIVVYRHVKSHSVAEPCYIPPRHQRHLDVITEETSDPSDSERRQGSVRPWENSEMIRKTNDIENIPNDWFGSEEEPETTSDEGGIDLSWRDGRKLDDVEGVEVVYLSEDSEVELSVNNGYGENVRILDKNENLPELVVVHTIDREDVKSTVKLRHPKEIKNVEDEVKHKKNAMDEIVAILDSTYEINKDLFMKQSSNDGSTKSSPKKMNELSSRRTENLKTNQQQKTNPPVKVITDTVDNDKTSFESSTVKDVLQSGKYNSLTALNDDKNNEDSSEELPLAQESLVAMTPPTLSRQGSSSSATSQSTAKYNPGQSPMSSETEDKVEMDSNRKRKTKKKLYNPKSLICLSQEVVTCLPHGEFYLKKIGFWNTDVSENEANYSHTETSMNGKLTSLPPSGISTRRSSYYELEHIYSQPIRNGHEKEVSPPRPVLLKSPPPSSLISPSPNRDPWVGLPTSADRRLLVCLSPSQSKENTITSPKEATELLELHKKFVERRGYHESNKRNSIYSPKSERSRTPDFNSPDLIRLEPYEAKEAQVYTPELLIEAANLLALKEYRQSRFKSGQQSNTSETSDLTVNIKINSDNLEKSDGLSEVTSPRTEIGADSEGPDSNRSAGTSRLLALLQDSGVPCSSPNNTVPLEMDRVDKSGPEADRVRRYTGSYISEWLTMTENVSSNADIILNTDFNKNVIDSKECVDNRVPSLDNVNEESHTERRQFDADKYKISKQGDIAIIQSAEESGRQHSVRGERSKSLPAAGVPALTPSGGELFREQMYHEYMNKVAERTERRQQKVIKISSRPLSVHSKPEMEGELQQNPSVNRLESEFMTKARERMSKLGINLDEEEQSSETTEETKAELPRHLQEFIELTTAPLADATQDAPTGVWSPGATPEPQRKQFNFSAAKEEEPQPSEDQEPQPAVWTPKSAQASPTTERKTFRPVNFESPKLSRKATSQKSAEESPKPPTDLPLSLDSPSHSHSSSVSSSTQYLSSRETVTTQSLSQSQSQETSGRLVTSHSLPDTSLDNKLPRAQNPTITLLQKAREGQLPRGAHYLEQNTSEKRSSPPTVRPNEVLYSIRKEYDIETEDKQPKKIVDLSPRKYDGIGPTTREGIPIVLRSEVQDENQQKWYKRMYDSLHRAERDKEYVTVRYKTRRGRYPYTSSAGYLSEPEPLGGYDSDYATAKYATLDRRRIRNKENDFTTSTMPRSKYNAVKHGVDVYKNQPGRIEDYEPGHSSIADKETKQWWDEVMDIFDGQFEQTQKTSPRTHAPTTTSTNKPFMTYALKESGYESDSTLVFKRRDETQQQLSPAEQKLAYKTIQKGGDVPLHGLRKPVPDKPKGPDDSELEYFPISPHLTRIRIHKTKQVIKPVTEIICYPITSIKVDNPPPVFSSYKRTAKTSSELGPTTSVSTPRPPSPPKRRSSHNSSTLRLYSKMSVSPSPKKSRLGRSLSGGVEVDSNVQYLKDRITSKLGVGLEKSADKRKNKDTVTSTTTVGKTNRYVLRTGSLSPSLHTTVTTPLGVTKVTKKTSLDRKTASSLRSRRDQAIPTRLAKSTELRAPAEVKKVLRQREVKERSSSSKSLPPGTVVKSSTTLYSSSRGSKKPKEDKQLKVTVAISAKGRELLRSSSVSSSPILKDPSAIPKRAETSTTTADTIPTTSPPPISHDRVSPRPSSRSDSDKRPSSRSTSRDSPVERNISPSVTKLSTTPIVAISPVPSSSNDLLKKPKKPEVSSEVPKKKKEKSGLSSSKLVSVGKTVSAKKNSKENDIESNGKKKTKKPKDGDSPTSSKKVAKKNGLKKSRDKNEQKKSSDKTEEVVRGSAREKIDHFAIVPFDKVSSTEFPDIDSNSIPTKAFFQNLLLRNLPSPTSSNVSTLQRTSSVLERAKIFHKSDGHSSLPYRSEPSLRLLNVYLNNKKPVTESKFRSLDREITSNRSSRSQSPICTRSRHYEFLEKIDKFDRLNNIWDKSNGYYSPTDSRSRSPELFKERSSSEPPRASPTDEMDHVETFGNISNAHWDYDNMSPTHSRSPSCRRIRSARTAVKTIESIGGLRQKGIRAKSLSEADGKRSYPSLQAQSTSSLNLSHLTDHSDYQTYVMELLHSTKKSDRFKELHKFYASLERMGELERTTSNTDLRPRKKGEEVIDYDRWKQLRTKERAEEELKTLYEKLKEDQKEKDLLFQPRDTEAIKWKGDRGLRSKEKSVEDLRQRFQRMAYEDSDIELSKRREIDATKDVYKPLWRGSSVVNLASSITSRKKRGKSVSEVDQTAASIPRPMGSRVSRSIGSRLWSSLSMEQVNALKNQLSEIYTTVSSLKRDRINRMLQGKSYAKDYEITVPSKENRKEDPPEALHVRCNSLLTKDQLYSPLNRRKESQRNECKKADSISSIPNWGGSRDSCSGGGDSSLSHSPIPKPLSESEKKKLSMSLSQEVKNRVSKQYGDEKKKKRRVSSSIVIPRETLGAVAAIKGNKKVGRIKSPSPSDSSPRTCYSIEMSEDGSVSRQINTSSRNQDKGDFLLVLTPKDDDTQEVKKVVDEWAESKSLQRSSKDDRVVARLVQTTSTSETDSGSSEASTVIHLGSREDVQKKVDYFEAKKEKEETNELDGRVSRSVGDVRPFSQEIKYRAKSAPSALTGRKSKTNLVPSESFSDLKELFGEKRASVYATTPLRKVIETQNIDLKDEKTSGKKQHQTQVSGLQSSEESLPIRSRSVSPDPMKYYRAYLNMVKAGDVRKLRDKFESLDDLYTIADEENPCAPSPPPKRYQSDPDLTREFFDRKGPEVTKTIVRGQEIGDVKWLKKRYEYENQRGRSKTKRVVSPVPLKSENRFMPHINVISKLAALQQQRSLTAPARPEPCIFRTGEVDRLRQQFEDQQRELSLLGQMFTSTPDVRELRDIAPYLECNWVAHQHPKPRSLSSPETQRSLTYSPKPRPASSSPIRRQTASILKPQQKKQRDVFNNQHFDPSIHRPLYRYQPPFPCVDTSYHYRPWTKDPHWWWRHLYPSAKPTVTFKEPIRGRVAVPQRGSYPPQRRPESPHRYVESEVTIHYRSPVRSEEKEAWSEEELQRRQAEAMRRIYQEERRRKYLQELQDMYSRRHTDNFTPSQKSPIPLNRYDDFVDDLSPSKPRDRTPEPKLVARALYNFIGQTSRELTFRRGDIIYVRRQIDKNWYEGEHNAMIGLFPFNYVEIIPYDGIRTVPKRPTEGQARAKFNFQAQTHLELPLVKGELVLLTRRVDNNWFEGRIGTRKGIFPVSYVEVLVEPGERALSPVRVNTPTKPVASPAAHSLHVSNNMGQHHYQPPRPVSYTSLPRQKTADLKQPPVNQTLHIDTQNEPVPYRVLYNYKPQNEDELELVEGETVYVMEKCDDGWYVGSSQRTGYLGTFPGNYVERQV